VRPFSCYNSYVQTPFHRQSVQMKSAVTSFLMILIFGSYALAADIYVQNRFLHFQGEIVRGDYQRVLSVIRKDPDEFLRYDWQLNSGGGDILEAIKIGDLIKDLYLRINVADEHNRDARCASACFFIFVSSVSRNAIDGTVGIHRPYFAQGYFANLSPEDAQKKYAQLTKTVRDFMSKNDVPDALIGRMFGLASNEIYWLDGGDLESIGDRPAWFDQYLLSRCGFNSRMFLAAVYRHDVARAKAWAVCEAEISYAEGTKRIAKYLNGKQ
jgi:hypothetical protein